MKVYVIKNPKGDYLSKYNNYDYRLESPCKPCWTEKLYNAKMFEEYDEADNFCNTIDCQIVEVELMETKDLSDYTKQVIEEIRKQAFLQEYRPFGAIDRVIDMVDLLKILDKIGEKEC